MDNCNPLHSATLDHAIELLSLNRSDRAIDFGAGKCEFLIRLIQKYGVHATAVELPGGLIEQATETIRHRIPPGKMTIVLQEAQTYLDQGQFDPYDVGVCIGSTHAFGGYEKTLQALKRAIRPGGQLLVGDLYWKQSPSAEFLTFLNSSEVDVGTHEAHWVAAENQGLTPLWFHAASEDDFHSYESSTSKAIEDYVAENPDDPDSKEMLERSRNWRKAMSKWGKSTWGFGLYLFRNETHGAFA